MQQKVKVLTVNADDTAQVMHIRQSACSGDCHKCSGCGAVEEKMIFTARNPVHARPGDVVIVTTETAPVLKAAAMLYMLPLLLFFAGYLLGAAWNAGALIGGVLFALSIVLCVLYDRRAARKQKNVFTITGYADGVSFPKKGDNDLD